MPTRTTSGRASGWRGARQGRHYVVRGGWGLFYGRTPSIMLGTAHSNNGVNIVSLTFTGDAVPTYPQKFDKIPAAGTAARPNIFYIDKDFANARLMQANTAVEWQIQAQTTVTATYLFVDGDQLSRSIDRNIGTLGARTFTVAGTGTTYSYPFFGADRPFAQLPARDRVRVDRGVPLQRPHAGAESSIRWRQAAARRVHAGQGRRHRSGRHGSRARQCGDDVKYASNPANFDADRTVGNNDQRHRFVASGVYSTNGLAGGLDGFMASLVRGWSFSAILTAQSGQPYTARVGVVDLNNDGNTSQRHRARNDAQSVPAAVGGDVRSANRPRPAARAHSRAADLGGLQSVQSRQHQLASPRRTTACLARL